MTQAYGATGQATEQPTRRALLEAYGRWYGDNGWAIAWTDTNDPRRGDPKRITKKGWQFTAPLPGGDFGAGLFVRGLACNPAVNLRGSTLIGAECDSPEDLAAMRAIGMPRTLLERSSAPTKLHLYYRTPEELETIPKVSFRFESGRIVPAANNYYVCAPALHPSGATYTHLPGPWPGDTPIAVMPAELYRELLARAGADKEQRRVETGPILEGERHEHLRDVSHAMRRYSGAGLEAITAALLVENARCVPPQPESLVRKLATDTYERVVPIRDERAPTAGNGDAPW